jgi:putative colanic acid biosynthesis glycosyltransferase WcaI
VTAGKRPYRLLVLNQYYWPGKEATARLLTDLCSSLAGEYDVTVLTGRLRDYAGLPREETRDGVRIVRVPSATFDRGHLALRAANYVSYLFGSAWTALARARPDVVLCMTDPPVIGTIALGVARRFGVPLVVVNQDVFPEIAVRLRRIENRALVEALRTSIRVYLKRADRLVAIGETMRRRLEEKGAPPGRIRVIPNWVDLSRISPAGLDNDWRRSQGLVGKFVVMHAGNVGYAQDLEALIRAATFLRDLDRLEIVIVGGGAHRAHLEQTAAVLDVPNVRFLDYQPDEVLAQTLSSADIHFVGLSAGLAGYIVPSRVYGILAAAAAIVAAVDEGSETAALVRAAGCGVVIAPGSPARLAEAIRAAQAGELDLAGMRRRARAYAERESSREAAIGRYRLLIEELLPRADRSQGGVEG